MSVAAARGLLAEVVTLLAPARITPVVLKGLVISALADTLPGTRPRPLADVDMLVSEGDRQRATELLTDHGYVVVARRPHATTLRTPSFPIDLDLHSRLVTAGLFSLDEHGFLARSVDATETLGVRARAPERYDLYAHLVAHFVHNRSTRDDRRRVRDFKVVAETLPMNATALAAYLVRMGLSRAARYTLSIAGAGGDRFADAVIRELPSDVRGVRLAEASRAWLERFPGPHPLAVPVPHLLDTNLRAGAVSFARHVSAGVARYLRGEP